jgi:hypothetical protein
LEFIVASDGWELVACDEMVGEFAINDNEALRDPLSGSSSKCETGRFRRLSADVYQTRAGNG